MAHRGHPDCPHPTKAACDKARRMALGQCAEMTAGKDPHPCTNWAVEAVDGRPLCGQHVTSAVLQSDRRAREAARQAEIDARIDAYMAWRKDHPSVWDVMPSAPSSASSPAPASASPSRPS